MCHADASRKLTLSLPRRGAHRLLPLAAIVLLGGCDWGESSPPPPESTITSVMPSAPNAFAPHAVSGHVFDAHYGMIASADVNFFIESSGGGRGATAISDQNGQFLGYLPDSRISVHVHKEGFVQPCAVSAEVRASVALQIEVVSATTLNSVSAPRPQSVSGIPLSGTILDGSTGTPQPVANAYVWIEQYDDFPVATTRSDLSGHYFACNLPTTVVMYVSKPGFRTAQAVVNPLQTPTFDVTLQRQ